MELKLKLKKEEYKALFNTLKRMPLNNTHSATLMDKAIHCIMRKFFFKMAPKMFDLKPQHTIKLSMSEAWALYCTLDIYIHQLPHYEKVVCSDILFYIHQNTL